MMVRATVMVCVLVGWSWPAFAQAAQPRVCAALPATVQVDAMLQPAVARLLAKSATFRRQCAIMTAAPALDVQVHLVPRLMPSSTRARATSERFAYGRLRVVIEIALGGDYVELLAHEFEHVTEQIEQVNLAALARRGRSGAAELADGAFETTRARDAGLAASAEMDEGVDPTLAAVGNGLSRAARTTWRRLGKVEAVAADPRYFHRK